MATVVTSMIEPDAGAIQSHLAVLFAPCVEHYPRGLIELRYGQDKPNQSAYFAATARGIAEASEFAANRSRQGSNVYVGVNPRKPETQGSAEDTDVAVAFWHFADLDSVDAVDHAGRRMKDLPPTFTVTTGTEPHRRPHLYWLLEEPVGNMQAWTERQRGIAQSFEGDAVINPSRIMRLAGTVNYPPQHKIARGYRMELTSLRTVFSDERAPVSPEQISTAYPMRDRSIGNTVDMPSGQNTLQAMAHNGVRPADYIAAIQSGDQWHNRYRDLVAHWISVGWTDAEIMLTASAMTLPGFSLKETERAVKQYISSARVKFNTPEPSTVVEVLQDVSDFSPTPWSCRSAASIPPREWLFGDIMVRRFVSLLVAPPGAGKSLFTLEVAVAAALKMSFGPLEAHEQVNVWVYNNEDPSDELDRRISAILIDKGIAPSDLESRLYVDSGEHRELLIARRDPKTGDVIQMPIVDKIIAEIKRLNIGIWIVDPFVETHAVSENNNEEINRVGRMYRRIAQETGCAVWLVHHTRKTPAGALASAPGDADAGRGAGSLGGVARFSATLFPMSEKDAENTGISDDDRHLYVRFDDAKANLKLKTDKATWWKKGTIELGNGAGFRASDKVGVLNHVELETRNKKEEKKNREAEQWAVISTALIAVFEGESMTLNRAATLLEAAAEPHGLTSQRSVERFLETNLVGSARIGAWDVRFVNETRKGGSRWIDRRLARGWQA